MERQIKVSKYTERLVQAVADLDDIYTRVTTNSLIDTEGSLRGNYWQLRDNIMECIGKTIMNTFEATKDTIII